MVELSKVKQDLIAEIEKRVEDHVLEPSNAELLNKLIMQADNDNEAISIAALGTTYKRTAQCLFSHCASNMSELHTLNILNLFISATGQFHRCVKLKSIMKFQDVFNETMK